MRRFAPLAFALILPLAACDMTFETDDGTEVSTSSVDDSDVRFTVESREGDVELGLTDDRVFFRFAEDVRRRVEEDIRESGEREGGLAETITTAVAAGVGKAMSLRVSWDVDRIKDIRWEDDRIRIELEEGYADLRSVEIDDEEIDEKFSRRAIERFSERFRELKEERAR